MRIFLDANILFSAALSKSRLAEFLRELSEQATLLTNAYAQGEAETNIELKYPKRFSTLVALTGLLKLVPAGQFELEVSLAEKDQAVLCGAIIGKADFLLTGDKKDFGHLFGATVQGVKIVTVEMLAKELEECGYLKLS
ncbi:MAG: hypothetical protein QM796_14465 [Chthoniobacteraceae bacterium]